MLPPLSSPHLRVSVSRPNTTHGALQTKAARLTTHAISVESHYKHSPLGASSSESLSVANRIRQLRDNFCQSLWETNPETARSLWLWCIRLKSLVWDTQKSFECARNQLKEHCLLGRGKKNYVVPRRLAVLEEDLQLDDRIHFLEAERGFFSITEHLRAVEKQTYLRMFDRAEHSLESILAALTPGTPFKHAHRTLNEAARQLVKMGPLVPKDNGAFAQELCGFVNTLLIKWQQAAPRPEVTARNFKSLDDGLFEYLREVKAEVKAVLVALDLAGRELDAAIDAQLLLWETTASADEELEASIDAQLWNELALDPKTIKPPPLEFHNTPEIEQKAIALRGHIDKLVLVNRELRFIKLPEVQKDIEEQPRMRYWAINSIGYGFQPRIKFHTVERKNDFQIPRIKYHSVEREIDFQITRIKCHTVERENDSQIPRIKYHILSERKWGSTKNQVPHNRKRK